MKKTNKKTARTALAIAAFLSLALCAFSCKSTPDGLRDDMTDREIIQLAQSAYDGGNTKLALSYYTALLQRYGTNTADYVEGRYEIAHIYVKQKNYSKAEPMLREILEIYDNSMPGALPGSFRKLSEMDLAKIPEKKSAAKSSGE